LSNAESADGGALLLPRPADVLVVDDDAKTLMAMTAILAELGVSMVQAGSGRQALLKLLEHDFAVILLDVQMPELDGFETAEIIRARDRSRHTPIIFLTAFNQTDRQLMRGYGLGAVDFMFKPIVPEILRSKVAVFVELQRKTQEVTRQAQLIRDAEQREAERRLADARQSWEADALRAQMEIERAQAERMVKKAEELADVVAERDSTAQALAHSNSRLALLSDSANRLLLGLQPRALVRDVCQRLTAHLDLEVYSYRRMDAATEILTLEIYGGVSEEAVARFRHLPLGEGVSGLAAQLRRRVVIDDSNTPVEQAHEGVRLMELSACVALPLVSVTDDRIIGTLIFGSRKRRCFTVEELATIQVVADQIAIALDRDELIGQLQSRNAELADADRRKDEFLAMLAHELRNPMAPIVNALHVVGHELETRGEGSLTRAHATMDRQVRHLIRLVDDLLDVSRITQGKIELRRERATLQAIVEQAVQIARPLIEARGHTLVVKVPDALVPLEADLTRMTQVVSNLLNNAAKYTDPGGRIEVSGESDSEEAVIRVRDNGIGIRPEMLPRVFELFVQANHAIDRAVGGLGIGLTLVKRMVQLHGGEVLARSEGLGKGSELVVTIPLYSGEELPDLMNAPAGELDLSDSRARRLRILVVEDNPDIRETLKDLLEIEGHEVTLAENGNLGVERAGSHDVALVDIGLPGLDGYAVARALCDFRKSRGFPIRLIAMTGYGQAEDRRRAIEAGFDAHLVKPVDPGTLTRMLADPGAFVTSAKGEG
jgi:signal transduction histidine kinase/DNA-binding response OmpR family regulator